MTAALELSGVSRVYGERAGAAPNGRWWVGREPVRVHLLVVLVGRPATAALAGRLLAGREPSMFARQPASPRS